MAKNYTKTLLISANVGSIFEDPDHMLQLWLREFLSTIKRLDPDFLAVHCQEVGGKNYEESMQHVNSFIKTLLASEEMHQFDKARVFLDEDFTAVDKFTALGSLYFVHENVQNVQIYDFQACQFLPVHGREVLSGNIESVSIKEKAKFPQEFFPDFKWSRKGFMRSRWCINNSVFDLVNIHLFHDASNIVAMEMTPSVYSKNRKRALLHTLERFENDQYETVPCFIFGDFNFRLDTYSLIKRLTDKTNSEQVRGKKNDISKIIYKSPSSGKPVLVVEKKGFDHQDQHNEVFSNNNNQWLHEYDAEPSDFSGRLGEFEITFPPSYPFSEDTEDGTSYMKTRCPSWCDRVMFTTGVREVLLDASHSPEYNMVGPNICMGDHKPIYLNVRLRHGTGNADLATSPGETSPQKQPLKKVISINGEVFEAHDMDQINIHDFASFEQEQVITRKFFSTIKRRQPGGPGLKKQLSFQEVARDIVRAENVLLALRHYSHRSDSESETEEDSSSLSQIEASPGGQRSGAPRDGSTERIPQGRQIKITEIESTKYIHVRQNGTSVRVFRETSV